MSEDPLSNDIELHLIDTRQLIDEAVKIRKVRELARQAKQAKKDLTAGVSPLGIFSPTTSNTPRGFFTGAPQTRKSAVGGARTKNEFNRLQDIVAVHEKQVKELKDLLKMNLKREREFEESLTGKFGTINTLMNPAGYGGKISGTLLSKLGKFGLIGSLVALTINEATDAVKSQFDAGGYYSTKLKVPRQALTVENIENENAYRAGTKYITDDLRVNQKTPQHSNTLQLTNNMIRYTIDNLGKTS